MEIWDFVVIGGGPAGLSAALVAAGNSVPTLLLEATAFVGGQVRSVDDEIIDLLGMTGFRGAELAHQYEKHLAAHQVICRRKCRVEWVRVSPETGDQNTHLVEVGPSPVRAKRLLLATGCRPRQLLIPGEELADLRSHRDQAGQFQGQRLAVVGAGDQACVVALDLARSGAEVLLIARTTVRARPTFLAPLAAHPRVQILEGVRLEKATGAPGAIQLHSSTGQVVDVNGFFVRIGVEVALPRVEPALKRTPDGLVWVDQEGRTSEPSIWAAGDLVVPPARRYVAAALGGGAIAARGIERDLRGG